jgi:putative transposase
MPWSENNKMDIRYATVREYLTGKYTKTELARIYGVDRKTLTKWINRYDQEGQKGLIDRPSRPKSFPRALPQEIVDLILEINNKKRWQAKKIESHLSIKYPDFKTPSKSCIHKVLERNELTRKYKVYRKWKHPGKPIVEALQPNDVMCVDYKGDFLLKDKSRCYPLTATDLFSRSLLGAFAHPGNRLVDARRDFEKIFEEYGLPKVILSDNGGPFCSKGIDGLSRLNVWWTELGIKHARTELGNPQQNGQHERMHREMKRLVTRPAGNNLRDQQKKLDEFRTDYNENLGHGGIGNVTPFSIYEKSEIHYPGEIIEPEYPDYFDIRRVSNAGAFRFSSKQICISMALKGKYIGLEEIDDGLHKVWFYDRFLGFFDEFYNRLEDKPGRYRR